METLDDRITRAGKLEAAEAITLTARLAMWIERAHADHEVHGGISPRAILLPNGELRRATLKSPTDAPTFHSYWSPEMLEGRLKSPADDVWALGTVLYLCLTGHAAFAGTSPEKVAARIASGGAAPLAVFDVGDDDLHEIVSSVLAVDPESRLSVVFDVKKKLEAWLRKRGLAIGAPMEVLEDEPTMVNLASIPPPPKLPGSDDLALPKPPPSPLKEFLDEETTLPRDEPPPLRQAPLVREARDRGGPPPMASKPPLPGSTHLTNPPPFPSRPPMPSAALADRIPPTSELLARAKAATSTPPPRLNPPKAARNTARPPALSGPNLAAPPVPAAQPSPPARPLPKVTAPPMKARSAPPPLPEPEPAARAVIPLEPEPEPVETPQAKRDKSLLDVELSPASARPAPIESTKSEAPKAKTSLKAPASIAPTASVRPGSMRPSKAPAARAAPKRSMVPIVGAAAGVVVAIYAGVRLFGGSAETAATSEPAVSAPVAASSPDVRAVTSSSGPANGAPSTSAPPLPVASASSTPSARPSATPSASPSAVAPVEDQVACFSSLLAPDSIAEGKRLDFAFVCKEVDPRKASSKVRSKVIFAAGGHVSDAMREWSMLGFYELAAFAAMRGRCCPNARPLELPPSPGNCASMQDALNTISGAAHPGATEAEQSAALDGYRETLTCVAKSGQAGVFGDYPPLAGGQDSAFMKTFQRTRN